MQITFMQHTKERIKQLKKLQKKSPNDRDRELVITQLNYLISTYEEREGGEHA